ncbi:MAG: CAP domain-containing protein [bacterium]
MRRLLLLLPTVYLLAIHAAAGATLDEKVAAEPGPSVDPEVVQRLRPARAALTSSEPARRQKAYAAFHNEGEAGRKLLADALRPLRAELLETIRDFRLSESARKKLLKAHEMMSAARKEALRVIFDKTIYPDANHGRAGQPVVDEAVDEVKTIYPHYEALYLPVAKRFARVLRAHERLAEIDGQLARCGVEDLELEPDLATLLPDLPPELLDLLRSEVAYRIACFKVLRYNRAVRTSLSAGERKVVDLTNEYRMQLGLRPLAVNERLVQAARKHSADMARLGYFGHTSPKPERRSAGQRCKLEGYEHFRGENCASGAGATGAFRMWYHSSGHHRNMLNPKINEIGVGHAGPWTEDFGARPDLDLDHPPRRRGDEPEPSEPGRPRRKKKPAFPWELLRYR